MSRKLSRFREFFSFYPSEIGVHPSSFEGLLDKYIPDGSDNVLVIQSIPDKFYFLLFGALGVRLKACTGTRLESIVVRGISGGIGDSWAADFKRSSLVSWLASSPWIRAYGDFLDGVAYRSASLSDPLDYVRDRIQANVLWRQLKLQDGEVGFSLRIDGIEIADLLIDSYLRFKPSPEFNVNDPFVRRLLLQAVRDSRLAHRYFKNAKPQCYLTSYTTYLEHGIPVRVALCYEVPVWSFGNIYCFGKQLTANDTYASPSFADYRSMFEALDRQNERLEEAERQLEFRLTGGIDAAISYMRRSAYEVTNTEPPSELEGAVVIFLHDFYDSPHVYPDLVFDDFWQWTCFTIDVLIKAGIHFFLKPHPNQISLSDYALERLRHEYSNLQWIPKEVSNVQLSRAGIACGLTVYGTVAHELAYLGIPSVSCARHPHHSFEFCRTARNRREYEDMLLTYHQLPVSKSEMRRQSLAFYYMHNLYGDGDANILRRAFVDFWRACNIGPLTEDAIFKQFQKFINLPEFDRFVLNLTRSNGDARFL
jgi:hypothetical protein